MTRRARRVEGRRIRRERRLRAEAIAFARGFGVELAPWQVDLLVMLLVVEQRTSRRTRWVR